MNIKQKRIFRLFSLKVNQYDFCDFYFHEFIFWWPIK